MQRGQYLGVRTVTAVDASAPSAAGDGWDLIPDQTSSNIRDAIAIGALFTAGTNPYIEVVPYLYFPDAAKWLPLALLRLYPMAGVTTGYGGLIGIPAIGGASRLYLKVQTYSGTPTNVALYGFAIEGWKGAGTPVDLTGLSVTVSDLPAFSGADPGVILGPATGAEVLYAEQTGNGASQVALAANSARKKAAICNATTSAASLWIGEGVTAEANKGNRVDPGGAYNWGSDNPFYGAINVWAAVGVTWSRSEA